MGDALYAPDEGRSLATATDARTGRQKFQRAFAQELLCPFDALSEFLDLREEADALDAHDDTNPPNEDRIEEAADYFDVSPRVVQSMLVNHRVLPCDVLEPSDAA